MSSQIPGDQEPLRQDAGHVSARLDALDARPAPSSEKLFSLGGPKLLALSKPVLRDILETSPTNCRIN